MIRQYRENVIPASKGSPEIATVAGETIRAAIEAYDNFEFSKALEAIWTLLGAADKYIVAQAPWKLATKKDTDSQAALDETLYTAAEVLRSSCMLLAPAIPQSISKIWSQLGMEEPLSEVQIAGLAWGQLKAGQKIGEVAPVFPRLDVKQSVAKLRELEQEEATRQEILLGKRPAPSAVAPPSPKISIDDFVKVDMRVGRILTAERVKGADKLLHMSVDIGEPQPRSIVAGIAEAYDPEKLPGRKVVIVANLQPRKLRGIPSDGMIVAASLEGEKPVLAAFLEDVPVGARLK